MIRVEPGECPVCAGAIADTHIPGCPNDPDSEPGDKE